MFEGFENRGPQLGFAGQRVAGLVVSFRHGLQSAQVAGGQP
jgi:hypothetical protein